MVTITMDILFIFTNLEYTKLILIYLVKNTSCPLVRKKNSIHFKREEFCMLKNELPQRPTIYSNSIQYTILALIFVVFRRGAIYLSGEESAGGWRLPSRLLS